jgi:hypothetical protein
MIPCEDVSTHRSAMYQWKYGICDITPIGCVVKNTLKLLRALHLVKSE